MSSHWEIPATLPGRIEVDRIMREARAYRNQSLRVAAAAAMAQAHGALRRLFPAARPQIQFRRRASA